MDQKKSIGRDHDRCYHRGRPLGLFGKRLWEELDCCFVGVMLSVIVNIIFKDGSKK
jgi:hypothetical protein